MGDLEKTTKYPRKLAKNETRDNRNLDLQNVVDINNKPTTPEDFKDKNGKDLNKRYLTEFNKGYPYIFDGLSYLCTWFANETYETKDGRIESIIARQDSPLETHYRTFLPINLFIKMCLGDNLHLREGLLLQLCKLAGNEEKKVLSLNEDYNIFTAPIRVDFIGKAGEKVTQTEKKNMENLKKRFANSDHYKKSEYKTRETPIEYVIIEFYKPLFESILTKNKKGGIGYDYFQMPAQFQANLDTTVKRLVEEHFFDNTNLKFSEVPMTSIDARLIFEVIADHDNGIGNEITIPAIELAKRCFSQYLNKYKTKDGEEKLTLPKSRGFEIRTKIKKAIIAFKQMGYSGKMDGGKFIPVELIETSVFYDTNTEEFKIKVLRPKNKEYPKYAREDLEPFKIEFK